ncbi:MAG: hypothetical protein IJV00_09225 [Clostridia bacterium]|nr:hypothetical protein [Clostridia bacterium]
MMKAIKLFGGIEPARPKLIIASVAPGEKTESDVHTERDTYYIKERTPETADRDP